MLHTIFQASQQSGSDEADFITFFYVFLWLNLCPLAGGQLERCDLHLNKFGKGPPGNTT